MTAGILGGNEGVVGNMTSGGSESLMLAVKAYRYFKFCTIFEPKF
jgi:glutamate/tyrosine decarboxylase-like PLP-dependent enzyme